MKSKIILIPILFSTFTGINAEAKYELDNLKFHNTPNQIVNQEPNKLESFFPYEKPIKISDSGYSSSSDDAIDVLIGFIGFYIGLLGFLGFFILPLFWKPSRKAIGLMNIIIGALISLSGFGAIIGIPMIIFGGIMLYI